MNDLIMIVEDDPYISHFLQMSFEQEGYRILMTTKGHEALSLFYSHQPDIIILDLGLPDIDGLEVIQEIRKISSKPIIVVSARLEEQEKLKEWMYDLLYTLYQNQEGYTESLYDGVGWTEEVKTFLRYNANKALMNLGQDPLFPDSADDVNPIVMNGISTGTSNHDFFSQVGNGYLLGEVEAMQDDDYNYGL